LLTTRLGVPVICQRNTYFYPTKINQAFHSISPSVPMWNLRKLQFSIIQIHFGHFKDLLKTRTNNTSSEIEKIIMKWSGKWSRDRYLSDRNSLFSRDQNYIPKKFKRPNYINSKIVHEIEKALGTPAGHYFRVFSLT
jgi:hypothetical protein